MTVSCQTFLRPAFSNEQNDPNDSNDPNDVVGIAGGW